MSDTLTPQAYAKKFDYRIPAEMMASTVWAQPFPSQEKHDGKFPMKPELPQEHRAWLHENCGVRMIRIEKRVEKKTTKEKSN